MGRGRTCTGERSTCPLNPSSSVLMIDSSSWPVVWWQYSHVLTTAHTRCWSTMSSEHSGGREGSAGCLTGGSCSSTRLAYVFRWRAHTLCRSKRTCELWRGVARLNERRRLMKSS